MLGASNETLRVGLYNDGRVGEIQRALNAKNGAGLVVDNHFGPLTERAVIQFQQKQGLPSTGVVDPTTWNILVTGSKASMPTTYPTVQQYGSAIGPLPIATPSIPWYLWVLMALGAYQVLGKSRSRRR